MKINITYDPTTVNATTLGSAVNLAAFEAQVNAAAQTHTSAFLDPVTVNITVKYGPVGLGQSLQDYYAYSPAVVKDALRKDVTSIDDLNSAAGVGGSSSVYLTHAQLKALGLIAPDAPGSDGTITFDNTPGLLDFTHSAAMSSSSYDLFGVAAHEISEIMGRVDTFKTAAGVTLPTVLTQFDKGGNFTIGSETLLKFNTAATGDRGDWDNSVPADDAFRAFATPGKVSTISATDLRVLDVVGWDHKALDLVFAIDTTASMGPYIDNVKANAISIVNTAFGTAAAPVDTRIGIVGFKDAAGPNGPGENTDLLNFTEQTSYDARKTATINAINSITTNGGGDIPEGDNSALLYALQGNLGDWRRSAQDHKIILFTDAPIKDTGLAAQVASAAAKLGVTVTSATVTSSSGVTAGNFTFTAPASAALALDAAISASPGNDTASGGSVFTGPTPATITFASQVYAIQVGSDNTATAGLTNLANSTGGQFFTGDATNLSDIIKNIITTPPPVTPPAPPVTPPPASDLSVLDTTTSAALVATGDTYTGPVAGLSKQYVNVTSDSLNINTATPNWFIHSGSGTDAINVSKGGGTNVLDGSTGSNFLTGGSGNDTFFLDDRGPTADVFSTVVGFHSGDSVTVFGVNATDFLVQKLDNQGAAGFTGLDFAFSASGHANANVVLTGFTTADLSSGRLTATFGRTNDLPGLPGSQYLNIHAT